MGAFSQEKAILRDCENRWIVCSSSKVSPAAVLLLTYINHGAISNEISAMTLRTERWLQGHLQDDDLNDRPIIGMM